MIDTIQSYLDSNEGGSDGKTRANTLMRQIEAAKSTEEVSAIITASLNNRKGLLKDSKQLKGRILHALCELNGLTEEMIDIVQYEACKDDWANYPKHMFSSSKEFKQTRNAAMLHVYEVDQSEKQFQKDSNLRGRVNSR
jgi:Na+/phosphate symporter